MGIADVVDVLLFFYRYIVFLVRGTCVALADFWIMYRRVGTVWRKDVTRPPSMEKRDLVVQLDPFSPYDSKANSGNVLYHINEGFIDRGLWRNLSSATVMPAAVVTGVSPGGIGFYTAVTLLLVGVNVHGVARSTRRAQQAERALLAALERQCGLHKECAGRTGRLTVHACDLADMNAVDALVETLVTDPDMRIIVCSAGPMCTPLRLTPQFLEQQFAVHHVAHSLIVLKMLQHRLREYNGYSSFTTSNWRIVILSSGAAATADPSPLTTFQTWESVQAMVDRGINRFDGYGNAKMCELLFGFALASFIRSEPRLKPYCTVNMLHPGPIRSRVIPNSELPLPWLLDGELAAIFRMTPVVAALFVVDLALSKRHEKLNGRFFRMGEDQSLYFSAMVRGVEARKGFFKNSTLFPGVPGPAVAFSREKQQWLWRATLLFLFANGYLDKSIWRVN